MKKFIIVINILFIVSISLFGKNGISVSFSPIEGNMSSDFKSSLIPAVEKRFSSAGFTLQSQDSAIVATHMLVVAADMWQEEQTSASDIALSVFSALGNVAMPTRERTKEIVEKYRISAKIVDIETTYVIASGMSQGNIGADPEKLVADLVKDVSKQLDKASKKKKGKNQQFSIACLPPSGSTNYMSTESKTPYLIAVESAFIDRGDNVGDRNRLEALMQELNAQRTLSQQLEDPNAAELSFGEVLKVNYFASVAVDTWIESRTSGLDVFSAIAGTAMSAATGTAARGLGGEQNRDIVQMVRVTIKVLDIETSYVVAAGMAQGDMSDDPVKIGLAAMKDLDKQLATIEKRKKKMKNDPISVACLPATGSMDSAAKEAYISALEISLIKSGYKVADRDKLQVLIKEMDMQRNSGAIKGDALDLGKMMNITHFVTVTADSWEEDETSGLDVFKAVAATGTAVAAGTVMTSGGGKESMNTALKTRLGAKVVGIENGVVVASGLALGELKDKPMKLSDNVLGQITKQVQKAAKRKKLPPTTLYMSCDVGDAGNLNKETARAYILSSEQVLMQQGVIIIDNTINDHIAEAMAVQMAFGEDTDDVMDFSREQGYTVNIVMDTWETKKMSDLSKAKIGMSVGSALASGLMAAFGVQSPLANNSSPAPAAPADETTYQTVINVRCLVQVVDPRNDDIVLFESKGEGLLKDDPIKLLSKVLKGAVKKVSTYHAKTI